MSSINTLLQNGEADTGNIDPVFLKEVPEISPTEPGNIDKTDQTNFEGFTYVNHQIPVEQ
jgi:hypothetical protein